MEWLRFSDVERSYGARRVFAGVSGVLRDGTTVGLIGPNGAGKSSLVRIVVGHETPDAGAVVRSSDARLGYLEQTASGERDATLRQILERAFARIHEAEERLRELERELSAAADAGDEERQARALRAYGTAREAFDRHGGADLERRVRSMLAAFDFGEEDLDRSIDAFSGGQRTRAALARLLLEEPDVLVLDEPTNHLDLETVRWLEDFLTGDGRAALVVSHDRSFLDRVASEIWELERGALARYTVERGRAYADYLEQKAERLVLAEREYANFAAEEKRRKAVVAELRTHGSHNYAQVRSREKQLEKLERVEAPVKHEQRLGVRLEAARRATRGLALEARNLAKAYDRTLFAGLSFSLARGQRLAIVGPNGAGKSTLLEILAGRGTPDRGSVKIMEGVRTAFFGQDAADELPAGVSAVDAVLEGTALPVQDARALLGRLGLGDDAGDKDVEAFSGGERRRIMLARLMAQEADCLFLDEPTNDLDIPSREALENVLATYGGAMVVVSHDRYVLRRLAERVIWLHDGGGDVIAGGYAAFEARSIEPDAAPAAAPPPSPAQLAADNERAERARRQKAARDLAAAEREVARLDEARARIELAFADTAVYDDREAVVRLRRELETTNAALEAAYAAWEARVEESERA